MQKFARQSEAGKRGGGKCCGLRREGVGNLWGQGLLFWAAACTYLAVRERAPLLLSRMGKNGSKGSGGGGAGGGAEEGRMRDGRGRQAGWGKRGLGQTD